MENNKSHIFHFEINDAESAKVFEDWKKTELEWNDLIKRIAELEVATITMVKNENVVIPLYDLRQVARIVRHFVHLKTVESGK